MENTGAQVAKTQAIRLFVDVLTLGPFLIYIGASRKVSKSAGAILIVSGVGTILYNLRNYIEQRKRST